MPIFRVPSARSWALPGLLVALLAAPRPVAGEFEPDSDAWDGLSELVALARDHGLPLQLPRELELDSLGAGDGLLIVHPVTPLPTADLVAFMREGGRLAIVDDFGTGDALLDLFDIERHPPESRSANLRLRDNRNVLVAQPQAEHPLCKDVLALVVNHPQALHHQDLSPLLSLSEQRDAVVLAGAVGAGRLVAVSDSSVLINNMLDFRGNRTFALNLLRYLHGERRLFLISQDAVLTGEYGPPADASSLSKRIAELTRRPLPPRTVMLLTLGIAGVLLFVAATSLPQRSTYLRAVTLLTPEVVAGFAGRVAFFSNKARNLLSPAISYKLIFEDALVSRLELPARASLGSVLSAARQAGLPEATVQDIRALLSELDALKLAQDRPAPPPVVSRRRFRTLIARGDRILASLDAGQRTASD